MEKNPVVSVRHLSVSFGRTTVVHDLNFEIAAGSTLALVGESGSGKSVTSLAIMRLLPERVARAEGSIILDNRDLLTLTEPEMRRVRGGRISMEDLDRAERFPDAAYGEEIRRHLQANSG